MIEQLRHVRLGIVDRDVGSSFATTILGLQPVDAMPGIAAFRSDKRGYTLVLDGNEPGAQVVGLSVRDGAALQAVGERLAGAGRGLTHGTPDQAVARGAKQVAFFEDHSGNAFELLVRPFDSGWRFHAIRDSGVMGLGAVALRSTDVLADQELWTGALGARVSDWAGEVAYIGFDEAHHRVALHPARTPGVLAVEFQVEDVDLLMQDSYHLQAAQVRTVHGPGRRPTSGQLFITFETPFGVLASFVAEGERMPAGAVRRPRQFLDGPASFDSWGSDNRMPGADGPVIRSGDQA